jgi:hypothetical protein
MSDESFDEPLGTETFEQGDEAIDESDRLDPNFIEDLELDPSLEPALRGDELELEETGAVFDDPETMVTLDGGIDDPDGVNDPTVTHHKPNEEEEGWDLDKPLA